MICYCLWFLTFVVEFMVLLCHFTCNLWLVTVVDSWGFLGTSTRKLWLNTFVFATSSQLLWRFFSISVFLEPQLIVEQLIHWIAQLGPKTGCKT